MLDMNTIGYFNFMEESSRDDAITRIADAAAFEVHNGEIAGDVLQLLAANEGISLSTYDTEKILTKLAKKNLYF